MTLRAAQAHKWHVAMTHTQDEAASRDVSTQGEDVAVRDRVP